MVRVSEVDAMRRGAQAPKEWRKHTAPTTMTAAELMDKELPPVKWAVSGVLPEGVTILAGKPKMGKSWLALGLCVSVAAGGYALGKIPAQCGGALYLGLEDQERRLQRRLKKVLAGEAAPGGLEVAWSWPRLDQGGVEALRKYLEDRPDLRLVVIDTLKKIRPRESGSRGVYDLDYEALEPLLPLAAEYSVAMLVVHHLRKLEAGDPFDMISGSTGLTGGVDGALVLKRDRGKQDATLAIDGRDVEEPTELALRWDADIASWSLMGDAEEYRQSEERRRIIALLERMDEPMSPKDIAEALEKNRSTTRVLLANMKQDGQVETTSRGYTVAHEHKQPKQHKQTQQSEQDKQGADESSVGPARPVYGVYAVDDDAPQASNHRHLTAAEGNERVQRLIDEGMAPKLAVAEVLGDGGEL
jgi:biotin operon repressor